jgi:hypothetical protein
MRNCGVVGISKFRMDLISSELNAFVVADGKIGLSRLKGGM